MSYDDLKCMPKKSNGRSNGQQQYSKATQVHDGGVFILLFGGVFDLREETIIPLLII